jgi:hypothetical protein
MNKLFLAYQNASPEANIAENQDRGRKLKLRNAQTSAQELTKTSGSMRRSKGEAAIGRLILTALDHPRSRASRPQVPNRGPFAAHMNFPRPGSTALASSS